MSSFYSSPFTSQSSFIIKKISRELDLNIIITFSNQHLPKSKPFSRTKISNPLRRRSGVFIAAHVTVVHRSMWGRLFNFCVRRSLPTHL